MPKTAQKPSPLADLAREIAERLNAGRKRLELTQVGLAEKAQLSRSAVIHYEQGRAVPGAVELIKLARALELSPNYILSGSDEFFPSGSPEHALAGNNDISAQAARMALCLYVLDRESRERISALLMTMVKQKFSKKEFEAFLNVIGGVQEMIPDMKKGLEKVAENVVEKNKAKLRKRFGAKR